MPLRFSLRLLALFLVSTALTQAAPPIEESLFTGKDLKGWTITDFAGHGGVKAENGQITMDAGVALTGITWAGDFPKTNFELEFDAEKIEGGDFFCAVTCPYGDSFFTFVVGGWGGGVVGISSVDGLDASENETTKFRDFPKGKWQHVRLRVTPGYIETWIDQEQLVSLAVMGRSIALRAGEIYLNQPFGLATYQTSAAVKNITLRRFPADTKLKNIALIAGRKSHGPGEHEYEKGLNLLKQALESSSAAGIIRCEVHTSGWPQDSDSLTNADAIVVYGDGSDHDVKDHPLLVVDHLATIQKQMKRGAGLAALHYTLFVPGKTGGEKFLDWIGGYFDYETGTATNHWFSKIETRDYSVKPVTSDHPILRGVKPFDIKEEYYFNLKFRDHDPRWTPLLTFGADPADRSSVVAWTVERTDGGRGFGYSGGHFHKNWDNPDVRRLTLNAILWLAHAEVPPGGVPESAKQ